MGTYSWHTSVEVFGSDGGTPTNQNTINAYTLPEGTQLRRTRFHCQLSCNVYSSPASDTPVAWSPNVMFPVGGWLNNATTDPANSPNVLDNRDDEDWLFWDTLQSRVDTDAVASTGIYRVTWETPSQGYDIQTRRAAVDGNSNSIWLGWQVYDPSGTINGEGTGWHAYLTGWISARFLVYTP
jgi:hypothetical protein